MGVVEDWFVGLEVFVVFYRPVFDVLDQKSVLLTGEEWISLIYFPILLSAG